MIIFAFWIDRILAGQLLLENILVILRFHLYLMLLELSMELILVLLVNILPWKDNQFYTVSGMA